MRRPLYALLLLALLALGGCGTTAHRPAGPPAPSAGPTPAPGAPAGPGATSRRGGYYMDDGPGEGAPPNLEQTPDAVPRNEPILKTAANRPYVVFGRTYSPDTAAKNFRQRGVASWYGRKFHGQKTSSGEAYNMYGMSAAHPTLPLPSYVRVTNLANGRTVIVRVNDRGPFHSERVIDLSYTAALKLGYVGQGSTQVEIEQIQADGSALPPPPVLVASAPAAPVRPPPAAAPAPVAPAVPAVPVEAKDVAPVALGTSTQPDGVYLQLGAFGAREGAEEFRIKTYQQLPWLSETMYIVARDRLFRVQLGPYKDRTDAGVAAEKIRETLQFRPTFVLR
jgi:rare lipoprotein A